jgi:hypothetical protein
MLTTVRLECTRADGTGSTGTGFFFSFQVDETQTIPLIVTNKHVISQSIQGTFVLTMKGPDGEPGAYQSVRLQDFEARWIQHPDPSVDLAVFPIAPLLNSARQGGEEVFFVPLGEDLIPSVEVMSGLGGIEDITMIGYPNGIWDSRNNLPIVRQGITATNPKKDYNGLPYFLIDCACFPGSSGSPVMIFNQGSYTDASGNIHVGTGRLLLLGILFAGPQHVAQGEVQTIEVPLQQQTISLSRIPNNLGFVVKAQKLMDFRKDLVARLNGSPGS